MGDAIERPERRVELGDLAICLRHGVRDFLLAPGLSVGIALVYTLGGWLLVANLVVFDMPYLVYPLAMGFALVAPFVAVAFYSVSRCLEAGEVPAAAAVVRSVRAAAGRDLRWMALITSFAFFIWMDIAAMLTLSFFGATALDFNAFLEELRTTTHGLIFIAVGHAVGAVIAMLVFSISVLSFPMLFDRDVDVLTAIGRSVGFVRGNIAVMIVWCGVIAGLTGLALVSMLVLMPVVLPVLGYASWHLYRRTAAS